MCSHDSVHPIGLVLCDTHGYLIDHLLMHTGTFHTLALLDVCSKLESLKFNEKFPVFLFTQDYEEPLMFFSPNEENEDDDLVQTVCGEVYYSFYLQTQMGLFSRKPFIYGFNFGSHAA